MGKQGIIKQLHLVVPQGVYTYIYSRYASRQDGQLVSINRGGCSIYREVLAGR
jgi:hypothetical protein